MAKPKPKFEQLLHEMSHRDPYKAESAFHEVFQHINDYKVDVLDALRRSDIATILPWLFELLAITQDNDAADAIARFVNDKRETVATSARHWLQTIETRHARMLYRKDLN